MISQGSDTETSILNGIVLIRSFDYYISPAENGPVLIGIRNISHGPEYFRRRRECRFYTACRIYKMAVSVTGSVARPGHVE